MCAESRVDVNAAAKWLLLPNPSFKCSIGATASNWTLTWLPVGPVRHGQVLECNNAHLNSSAHTSVLLGVGGRTAFAWQGGHRRGLW